MDIRIISLFFIIGVYTANEINLSLAIFIGISVFLLCLIRAAFKNPAKIIIPISILSLISGNMLYKLTTSEEFLKSTKYISQNVTVTGRICEIPERTGDVMKYLLDDSTINGEKLNERILVYSPILFEYGNVVSFEGNLEKLPYINNFGDYNTYEYYRQRNTGAKLNAVSAVLCNTQRRSAFTVFSDFKYSIAKLIDNYYTGDIAAALKAVIIGHQNDFSKETQKVILRTGTRSLFHPAYIHLLIFMAVVGSLRGVIHRKYRDFLIAFLAAIYLLFNLEHASFFRAFLFAAIFPLSRQLLKKAKYSDLVFGVILIAGIINPLILKNTGFVFSLLSAVLIKAFSPLLFKDNHGWALTTVKVQCFSGIATLPLAAYCFGAVSPYLPLAAPIFLAAVVGMLILAPILLILLATLGTAPLVGSIVSAFAAALIRIPYLIDKLYGSRILLASPSAAVIGAHFIAVLGIVYIIRKKNGFNHCLFIVSALLFIGAGLWNFTRLNKAEIHFVNVGHGDAAVISTLLGENILIDGGGSVYSDYNIGEEVFVPYLMRNGLSQIDAAFVSHYHGDHTQGIVAAIENLNVRNLFLPGAIAENEYHKSLVEAAKKRKTNIHYITSNTRVSFRDGLSIDVAVPDELTAKSTDLNDTSLLMKVQYGDFDCLFTGDMTHLAEKNLLQKGKVPGAEVLKIAHHGSENSTAKEFFDAVSPQISVISIDRDSSYGLPSQQTLDRIKASQVLRTDLHGEIRIMADKKGNIDIKTLR